MNIVLDILLYIVFKKNYISNKKGASELVRDRIHSIRVF